MTLQEVFNINIKQGAGVVDCTNEEISWHFNEYGLNISSKICVDIITKVALDFSSFLYMNCESQQHSDEWLYYTKDGCYHKTNREMWDIFLEQYNIES